MTRSEAGIFTQELPIEIEYIYEKIFEDNESEEYIKQVCAEELN